jgi:tRNA (guanine-N7-)-methyltransferase
VGKGKLNKFQEIETFNHVIEPDVKNFVEHNHRLKGKWHAEFFKNENSIILELGCGKGEYSVGLSKLFPNKNFVGVDIKGARIWRGAKTSLEENINNIAFLRTRIELINSFFAENEVDEIWITFPDPQLKKRRTKKRLTSTIFLHNYQKILKQNSIVHLKTDSRFLFDYTNALVKLNELEIIKNTTDLYDENWIDDVLSIQTHYEKLHIDEGDTIHYISFYLDKNKTLIEPDFQSEDD